MPDVLGEYVDRLCSVEMAPGAGNMPRGTTHLLYEAARRFQGRPLSTALATALIEHVHGDDVVVILTGAGGPPVLPHGEVDGLPGAALLARLAQRLGARVAIGVEDRVVDPLASTCKALGLSVSTQGADAPPPEPGVVTVFATPIDKPGSARQAMSIWERWRPAAVIGIEKLSPNRLGRIHGATGLDYDDVHSDPSRLVELARAGGALTAGIGDGGNEVGFGSVADAVRAIMPAGAVCQCDCGGGSASSVATDYLVAAAISDWGALGVTGVAAYVLADASLLPTPDEYEALLRAAVAAGALDGVLGTATPSDDGVPLEVQRAFVTMLAGAVRIAMGELASPGH